MTVCPSSTTASAPCCTLPATCSGQRKARRVSAGRGRALRAGTPTACGRRDRTRLAIPPGNRRSAKRTADCDGFPGTGRPATAKPWPPRASPDAAHDRANRVLSRCAPVDPPPVTSPDGRVPGTRPDRPTGRPSTLLWCGHDEQSHVSRQSIRCASKLWYFGGSAGPPAAACQQRGPRAPPTRLLRRLPVADHWQGRGWSRARSCSAPSTGPGPPSTLASRPPCRTRGRSCRPESGAGGRRQRPRTK
jgi:hypothetical protein